MAGSAEADQVFGVVGMFVSAHASRFDVVDVGTVFPAYLADDVVAGGEGAGAVVVEDMGFYVVASSLNASG